MVTLEQRREKLQDSIDEFSRMVQFYLPAQARNPPTAPPVPDDSADKWEDVDPAQSFDDEESDDDDTPHQGRLRSKIIDVVSALPAEEQVVQLPSRFGSEVCKTHLKALAEIEVALRRAQANDALHNLRLAIGQKSFLYRHKVRKNATNANHKMRLRSRNDIASVSSSIDVASKIYASARRAMKILGAPGNLLEKYQVLQPKDVQTNTAVVDFNAPGQRNRAMSWIWHSHNSAQDNPEWLQECGLL